MHQNVQYLKCRFFLQERELCELREFISKKKPHAICVGAESRDAQFIVADIKEIVKQLVEDEQFPLIPVEILDNDLAKIYANSIKGNVSIDAVFTTSLAAY